MNESMTLEEAASVLGHVARQYEAFRRLREAVEAALTARRSEHEARKLAESLTAQIEETKSVLIKLEQRLHQRKDAFEVLVQELARKTEQAEAEANLAIEQASQSAVTKIAELEDGLQRKTDDISRVSAELDDELSAKTTEKNRLDKEIAHLKARAQRIFGE